MNGVALSSRFGMPVVYVGRAICRSTTLPPRSKASSNFPARGDPALVILRSFGDLRGPDETPVQG